MNRYLLKSTIVAALGGLLFGFDTVVISGATSTLSEVYHLTPMLLGFTVASALLGTVLGSMFAAAPSDRYGRRQCLQALAVLYVVTALGCAARLELVRLRLVPLYRRTGHRRILRDRPHVHRGNRPRRQTRTPRRTLPVQYRGRNPDRLPVQLRHRHAGFRRRRVALETGRRRPARRLFLPDLIRHSAEPALADPPRPHRRGPRDLHPHRRARSRPRSRRRRPLREVRRPHQSRAALPAKYRRPIFLAIAIGFFNQLSGINAILYYLNDIFKSAGFDKVSSDLQAVAIGATNLLFTMIAMSVIDRLGPQETAAHRRRRHRRLPRRRRRHLHHRSRRTVAGLAAHRLHRLLRLLARRRHLGLPQRGLPQPGARQGPEPRQLHPLDHERHHRVHLPPGGHTSRAPRRSSSSP